MSFDQFTYGYEDPSYHYLCVPSHDPYNVYNVTIVPPSNPYGAVFKNVIYATPPQPSQYQDIASSSNNNIASATSGYSSLSSSANSHNNSAMSLVPMMDQCSLYNNGNDVSYSNNATADSIDISDLEKSLLNGGAGDNNKNKSGDSIICDEPDIVKATIDAELTCEATVSALMAATPDELKRFFNSIKATRFVHQLHSNNKPFRPKVQSLILNANKEVLQQIAVNPIGNFILQDIITSCTNSYRVLCDAVLDKMKLVTLNKYGCRVVQTLFKNVPIDMVHELVDALSAFVVEASSHRHATHVIHCLAQLFNSTVYERVVGVVCEEENLYKVAEDKFGCRVIQHFLENLANEITHDHVPQILNDLVGLLLLNAERFASNEFANYIVQYLITHAPFKRQRDYIIDRVVTGHILTLSQDKFGSHVVEASLNAAGPAYLCKLCEEIFLDYESRPGNRTALEMMMFDQYGNYVVQRLLQVCIEVSQNRRIGDHHWIEILGETVVRNMSALQRYSSGKKIINTLRTACPQLFEPSNVHSNVHMPTS